MTTPFENVPFEPDIAEQGAQALADLCDVGAPRRLDHIGRDCWVIVEEIAGMGAGRVDVLGVNVASWPDYTQGGATSTL